MMEKREKGVRRPYVRPDVTHLALDVMISVPNNCKLATDNTNGLGAPGPCTQSSQPGVACMNVGS
ncbi:MAG: hypothetical protein A2Y95_11625 [Deltaproteobacteria bacterium RBG_13_65_10]|jgi:hypothetical protein|nr:MAG: hypothetical protein A2Y95_11625 [Deltaproteobacteria bacterium RBG_13_65_10]